MLESLVIADELNDDQRCRVWLQIEQTKGLEVEFFAKILPKVAGTDDCPRCVSQMLDFEKHIVATATNQEKRYSLGQGLVNAFRVSSSLDAKNRLAAWLKRLNVEGVLKELPNYGDMSEDEIAILDSQFGRSKEWRKVKSGSA